MTADAAPGAIVRGTSSADGFSGETDRFRDDCGLARGFLKNWTVGLDVVDDEASGSDMMVCGIECQKTRREEWQPALLRTASRTQEPFASIANPDHGRRILSRRRRLDRCFHCWVSSLLLLSLRLLFSQVIWALWQTISHLKAHHNSHAISEQRRTTGRTLSIPANLRMIERCTN